MPKMVATAKTSACAVSSHTFPVIRTSAKITMVISAPNRGPLGSMSICGIPSGDAGGVGGDAAPACALLQGRRAAPQGRGATGWLLSWAAGHSAVATRQKSTARRLVSISRGDRGVPVAAEADLQAGTVPMLCAAGL